jgi:hypothetical protein
MDFQLFEHVGQTWLLYLLLISATASYVGGLVWVWFPFRHGFLLSLLAILLDLVESAIAALLSGQDTEFTKAAFITSRQDRGLLVRAEVLQMMESPYAHALPLVVSILFALLWVFLLSVIHKQNVSRSVDASGPRDAS